MNTEILHKIKAGEDSFTEFKSGQAHNDSIAKEIVAFANTKGGHLFLGVEDDGTITGVDKKFWEEKIIQIARNNVEPGIVPALKIYCIDDKSVLEIIIDQGKHRPYKVKTTNKYYIRAGTVSTEPSREELVRLFQEGELFHFEVKSIAGTSRKDLDHILITDYLKDNRKMDVAVDLESSLLTNLQFLSENREATVLGMLFFGKEPLKFLPQSGIALHRFGGIDKTSEILENREAAGPIPHLIDTGIKFIQSNNHARSRLPDGSLYRVDSQDYEEAVFREILCNAFQHRDWSIFGQKIQIQMFTDRLEISSPGKLPNTMNLQNALVGNSFYRNPLISQTLRDYGLVDKMGRGLLRVMKLCRDWNIPTPEFYETPYLFTVILYNRNVAAAEQ